MSAKPKERRDERSVRPRQQRLIREAEAANAEAWGQWSSDVAERLARAETRLLVLLGGENGEMPDGGDPVLFPIIDEFVDTERRERTASIAKLASAWTERLEAEIATLDERLSAKLDSKVFDLASVRQFRARLEKMASDLQADVTESLQVADAKIAELGDRFAALSKRRDIHALSVRLAVLERALPKPTPTIKSWRLDLENYTVVPTMSDGKEAAALDLYPLFRRLADDLADTRP